MAFGENDQTSAGDNISGLIPAPTSIVSDSVYGALIRYSFFFAVPVAVFGVVANMANIIVFYRLGLNVVANLSLFALAISDLISLCYMIMACFAHHPDFFHFRLVLPLIDVSLVVAPIQYCASAFGSWVTAIISVERSFCVVFPMKVKLVFTHRTVSWLMIGMLFYQISGVPMYTCHTIVARVSPPNNRTLYFVDHAKWKSELSQLFLFISFSVPTVVCFIVVTIATILLITKFKQSVQLRQAMSGKKKQDAPAAVSTKDAIMIRSVTFVCIIYLIGYLPSVSLFFANNIDTSIHMFDPVKKNVVRTILAVSQLTRIVSSSVNIFVYVAMSSKFKETFKEVFFC